MMEVGNDSAAVAVSPVGEVEAVVVQKSEGEDAFTSTTLVKVDTAASFTVTTGLLYQVGRWLPRLILALLLVTVVDLLVFYKTFKAPVFHHIDVFLEPTADTSSNSDASFSVQGNVAKSSWTMSADSSGASCEFYYRPVESSEYSSVGSLDIALPADTNTPQAFDIHGDLTKVQYDTLRAVYNDVMGKITVTSQVKLICAVELEVSWLQAWSVHNTYHLQQELRLEPFRKRMSKSKNIFTYSQDKKAVLAEDDDVVHQAGKENAKHVTMKSSLKHASLYGIQYELLIRLNKNFKPDDSIKSLVLHVPKISYATAFVDKVGEAKSYLRLKAKPFLVDFAKVPELIDIDIGVSCTPYDVYEGNSKISSTSAGGCTLISPFDIQRFKDEYQQHGFVNITSHATHLNFITKFMGAHHYIRTVPPKDQHSHDNSRALTIAKHAQGSRMLATTDPIISTGSDCIEVDTDGIYFSQACSVIEKGFFMLGVSTFNDDGYIGYLRSTTSWAPSGPVAFSSELVGTHLNVGELVANAFFSENFQNLTLFTFFNYTKGGTFTEDLSCNWDLNSKSGELHATSLTIVDDYAPVLVAGDLAYGNSNYTADLMIGDGYNRTVEATVFLKGNGRYGGNWNKWWATLDDSSYYYNREYEGGAIGAVSYDVPNAGTVGDLVFSAKATDNVHADYVLSNFTGGWFTDNTWTADGTINADFYLDVVPEALVVNVTSGFHYGDHAYLVGFNMGLDEEAQYLAAKGVGGYGGTWSRFHGQLANSTLIYTGDVVGHAVGAMNFFESNNGANVGIAGTTRVVDSKESEVFHSASDLTWYTESAWVSNGNIAINNLVNVNDGEGANWNVSSYFKFTESNYTVHVYENSVNATSPGLLCDAFGTYLMKYYDWTVDLASASCAYDDDELGLASANAHIISDSSFETLRVFYGLDVFNGDGSQLLATKQSVQAYPDYPAVANDDNTIYYAQQIYVYEYLYNINYATYMVNATANNKAVQAAMRMCLPFADNEVFQTFQVMDQGSYPQTFLSYYLYFNTTSYSEQEISDTANACFASGDYYANLIEYAQKHPNASALADVSSVLGGSYPTTYTYDDDGVSQSPWVYTGHIHVDSFWNLTDMLMWNVSAAMDYANNSYRVALSEGSQYKHTAPQSLFTYGKGGYEGSVLDWTITLNESSLMYNNALVGSATGAIAGLTTSNGMINFTATALDAHDNQVMYTVDQAYWNSEASYNVQGKFGVISQFEVSDAITWNTTAQFEYGHHNYTVLFYDNNVYDNSDDVIIGYAMGQYDGSFPMDWYATIDQCFVTYNGELEANIKGKIKVDIADNGTVGTLGLELYDYDSWKYYSQANAYHVNESMFATVNYVSYKYDGDVAGGKFMTQEVYDSAPVFLLASKLDVDLLEDTASLLVYETMNGEEGVNVFGNAKYDMDTGMIANMQLTVYYEENLIYGFNTNYDMQLENFDNSNATGRPSFLPTAYPSIAPTSNAPTLSPSKIPSLVPTFTPSVTPTTTTIPSAVPSVAPSTSTPSMQPNLTPAPSAVPTLPPTANPSMLATIAPIIAPTAAPSVVPSMSPMPTARPTTFTPSASPSTPPDATVEFAAAQVISGISYDSYIQNQDANDQAIKQSIADCMDGISANDITNFVVTAAQRLRQLQTIQIIIRATSSSIQATYVILSTNPTLNYDSLSSQLQKSVDNGDFNNYLSQNAASIPGATALVNCTSASIDTEDTLPPSLNNDDNDETLSAGAIAGIVIGVVIFVAFVAACFYWLFVMKGSISSPTSSTNATPTAPSIPDVEMSSESEVKWTDNMIRKA